MPGSFVFWLFDRGVSGLARGSFASFDRVAEETIPVRRQLWRWGAVWARDR